MHGIGDALSPGVLHCKAAAAVAGASVLLPPVGSIAMEPTPIEFVQIAHCGPRDEPTSETPARPARPRQTAATDPAKAQSARWACWPSWRGEEGRLRKCRRAGPCQTLAFVSMFRLISKHGNK